MKKNYTISTKIKLLGTMLSVTMFAVILSTIYLNQKNINDALTINIAGKQRMLTQRITKNIYYANQLTSPDFAELNSAVKEFEWGLKILNKGSKALGIQAAPTDAIKAQLTKVLALWNDFQANIANFKEATQRANNTQKIVSMNHIIKNNNELLNEVDQVVMLLTQYSESKRTFLEKFQYIALAFLLYLVIYSILVLREIEQHVEEFLHQSKEIIQSQKTQLPTIEVNGEKEIVEVATSINCFINKINDAMAYSNEAIKQSQNASKKLEELTDEFDTILGEMQNHSVFLSELDKSEDIVLDSTESLVQTTKKLQNLKKQLDSLMLSCQTMN